MSPGSGRGRDLRSSSQMRGRDGPDRVDGAEGGTERELEEETRAPADAAAEKAGVVVLLDGVDDLLGGGGGGIGCCWWRGGMSNAVL